MTYLLDTNKGSLATFDQGLAKAFADESPLVSLIK